MFVDINYAVRNVKLYKESFGEYKYDYGFSKRIN